MLPNAAKVADLQTRGSFAAIKAAQQWSDDFPVYALGASSGGTFAGLLPFHMKLQVRCAAVSSDFTHGLRARTTHELAARQGTCIQIMAWSPSMWKKHLDAHPSYPPTLFVHMERDERTASHVRGNLELLQSRVSMLVLVVIW